MQKISCRFFFNSRNTEYFMIEFYLDSLFLVSKSKYEKILELIFLSKSRKGFSRVGMLIFLEFPRFIWWDSNWDNQHSIQSHQTLSHLSSTFQLGGKCFRNLVFSSIFDMKGKWKQNPLYILDMFSQLHQEIYFHITSKKKTK